MDAKKIKLEVELLENRQLHAGRVTARIREEVMNGHGAEWAWASAEEAEAAISVAISEKKIELYELTGEPELHAAITRLETGGATPE